MSRNCWDCRTLSSPRSTTIASAGPRPLFDAHIPALALKVAAHAVREFDVSLDQLHNDSTTLPSRGLRVRRAGADLAGTIAAGCDLGHNKDHRPDLKQLLYILTVTGDGAVRCSSASRAATPLTTAPTRTRGSCFAS